MIGVTISSYPKDRATRTAAISTARQSARSLGSRSRTPRTALIGSERGIGVTIVRSREVKSEAARYYLAKCERHRSSLKALSGHKHRRRTAGHFDTGNARFDH